MKAPSQLRKNHWESVYQARACDEVSWFKDDPRTSIKLIASVHLDPTAWIMDVGGGDSKVADRLIELGFQNICVLDISRKALERSKARLGRKAKLVCWIESDILEYETGRRFDLWHDWAAFHFLTRKQDIRKYVRIAGKLIRPGGYLILATFSSKGPLRCSGLNVTRYCVESIQKVFEEDFVHIKSFREDHKTPFQTKQNFLYTLFRKKVK